MSPSWDSRGASGHHGVIVLLSGTTLTKTRILETTGLQKYITSVSINKAVRNNDRTELQRWHLNSNLSILTSDFSILTSQSKVLNPKFSFRCLKYYSIIQYTG